VCSYAASGHESSCSPPLPLLSHNQTARRPSVTSPEPQPDEQQALPHYPDLAWQHSFALRDDGAMGLYTVPLIDVMAGAGLSIGGSALVPSWRPLAQDRRILNGFTGPWSLFSEYNGQSTFSAGHALDLQGQSCLFVS
jgi:hypothetical protein